MPRRQSADTKAFGLALRQARLKLGYTQEELADLARLHRTYIGGVERGERNLSLKNIFALSNALKCAPSDLLQSAEELLQGFRRK